MSTYRLHFWRRLLRNKFPADFTKKTCYLNRGFVLTIRRVVYTCRKLIDSKLTNKCIKKITLLRLFYILTQYTEEYMQKKKYLLLYNPPS